MATVTKPIALDESFNTTEVTPRNIADVLAEGLSHITGRTASEVEYDNTDSGLTADNVQDALDEIAESVPTLPSVDIQTAVDEFETYNGGLLSSLKVTLSPNQDLHGYAEPWVGGAGANQWDEEWRSGYYQLNTQASNYGQFVSFAGAVANKNSISVLPSTTYAMCVVSSGSGSIFFYDSNHDVISHTLFYTSPFSFTTPANCAYVNFNMNASPYGATYKNDIALNYPSTVTTYSPYSNICPISGHTQVDVEVSDGQTTQEQVTVNLGGTYYSGTLDVVSGVFVPDTASVEYDGSSDEGWGLSTFYANTVIILRPSDCIGNEDAISEQYKSLSEASDLINEEGMFIGSNINVRDNNNAIDVATWKAYLANHPLKVCYKLATPTPIQLSPTMVKALVGENHLSAPLDGQEITESKYKQTFTFDDVIAYIQSLS